MIERKSYFDQLEAFKDKQVIKVVTGIRRSGKSVIMEQFAGHLAKTNPKSTIIYIKLDQMENEELLEYHALYAHIKDRLVPGQMNYIFIDEVQMCRDFQKPVESLFTMQDVDIYLTGSNTDVLSGELASLLSGRYITIHIQPFSFQEYRLCAKENNFPQQSTEEAFQDFFKFGGFPFTLQLGRNPEDIAQYISNVYDTIILKDIIKRHQIKDIKVLESIIKFMFSNAGKICTAKKISDTLTSSGRKSSQPTVESYLGFLEECFLVYKVERYDIRGKEILKSLAKYYIADTGMRNMLLGYRNIDTGHLLENLVFLELKRRKYSVFTGKNGDKEIDFIAQSQNEIMYIQVSESLKAPETLERELSAFKNIRDSYPRILISMEKDFNKDYDGVRSVYALDFLTGGAL